MPKGHGEDRMCWRGHSKDGFQVKSYYNLLFPSAGHLGPWKQIWKTGAPPRVAFFVWAAALGRILTTDNLRRRHVIVLDWCCMCKESGESISHLLMHCSAAREVWLFIFNIFGIQWVMPSGVLDLLSCWGIAAIASGFGSCGTWSLFACFGVFGGREMLEVLRGWREI
uniref:Reverse transcriptase zinc-binding domain-containing protein n=1 Tax=Fagus sylvatica TaxID=28930 RepID=A0A2N9J333_FAGSY